MLDELEFRRFAEVALEELTVANDALQVAEQTLSESEEWFRQLLANSSDLIVVIDEQARVMYANPATASARTIRVRVSFGARNIRFNLSGNFICGTN